MNTRLHSQIIKEILSVLRDPRARMALIVPPLLQLVVFSFAATLEVRNVKVAILDSDHGAAAHELVQRVEAAGFIGDVVRVQSLEALKEAIDSQHALLAVHLLPSFSRNVAAGRPAKVQVLLDGRRANGAQIALGYLNAIARDMSVDLRSMTGGVIQSDGSPSAQLSIPQVIVRHGFNPNLTYYWFIVPSLSGILAMFTALLITALSIARERELGTFDQLLVSPATALEIIVSKTVPAVLVGTLLATVMITAGIFVFRIPFTGSFLLLLLSLVLYILSIIGLGLMLSAICQTQQQAILGTFSIGIPMVIISGFATPIENMPPFLQVLAELSPLKHYLIIVQGCFLKALPASEVLANAWPLAAIALVTLPSAIFFVKRRLQ